MATRVNITLPSPAEVTNWNQQAQKPAKTYTRTLYNYYSNCDKGVRVIKAFVQTGGNPVTTAFLAFGVPFAKKTGSKVIENATELATEVVSAVTNPVGWVAGKAAHEAGKLLVRGIQEGIQHPQTQQLLQEKLGDYVDAQTLTNELKDVTEIGVGLLANKAAIPLEQALSTAVQHIKPVERSENRKRKLNGIAKHVLNVAKRIKEDRRGAAILLDNDQPKNPPVESPPIVPSASVVDAEVQKLALLKQRHAELLSKNQAVNLLSANPQELVNNAANSSGGNKAQFSMEASKQANAFSINPDNDPLRNTDTFQTTQSGKNPDKNNPLRMGELVAEVKRENELVLEKLKLEIEQQQEVVLAAGGDAALKNALIPLEPGIFHSLKTAREPKHFTNEKEALHWAKEIFVKNENMAKESGATDLRFAIAKGVARDIALAEGKEKVEEGMIHRILNSMSPSSDRRWYNDVTGEIYQIVTGSVTHATAYKEKGLKKAWSEFTDSVKDSISKIKLNVSCNSNGCTVEIKTVSK